MMDDRATADRRATRAYEFDLIREVYSTSTEYSTETFFVLLNQRTSAPERASAAL